MGGREENRAAGHWDVWFSLGKEMAKKSGCGKMACNPRVFVLEEILERHGGAHIGASGWGVWRLRL